EVKTCPTPTDVEPVVENLETSPTVEAVVENLETSPTVEPVVENLETSPTVEPVVENLETSPTVEPVVENLETSSSGWLDFHYKVRIDSKQHSIRQKQDKCTGPYYTYRWLEGKKQRAKYIPGKKMGEVYRAIAIGQPVNEILKIISKPSRLEKILKK
ncbi:hypothetical protein, partial [Microcoleus sp. Aus8_D4]|uniref:hypothetical protein n=1 Tax=Microcoleus sp. Aus8_D4 TaxID=2818634 RepID=UPI002FD5A151